MFGRSRKRLCLQNGAPPDGRRWLWLVVGASGVLMAQAANADCSAARFLRHPAALVQAAWQAAGERRVNRTGGMVCSSLTLAGVLYTSRATSPVSL